MHGTKSTKNAWGQPGQVNKNKPSDQNKSKPKKEKSATANEKFQAAHTKNLESAKKYVSNYESSSEEEGGNDNDIVQSIFKNYTGVSSDLVKTQQFLENTFNSGAAICLICIRTVKRADAIWSCHDCYTFFHLLCIQRWANDSTALKQIKGEEGGYYTNTGEYIPKKVKEINWDCPKCRRTYEKMDIPRTYECFCGNETTPPNHPWLIPHSCGETCKKALTPVCGHKCVLLCHPGPCPPCPQMITSSCKCGQSNLKTIRCSQQSWNCLKKCSKLLPCSIHVCDKICHSANECPPCNKKIKKSCLCGNESKEQVCSNSKWQCRKKCGKHYSCGVHACEQVCHSGDCGDCPKSRTCPCGKKPISGPCSDVIDTCGDTCGKTLACNQHLCFERCHKGDCSECRQITEKTCRCGNLKKEMLCSKTLTCENKCKKIKDCKQHTCNRKCCDENCPPCDKICSKTLSCGRHKCQSLCHVGACYPCIQKGQNKCRCGHTTIPVPCGREKQSKPPICRQPCRIPSKCHHQNVHECHFGDCPPCTKICDLKIENCEHLCRGVCHDAVKVLIKDPNFKPAGPWDLQQEKIEIQKLPHPKCNFKVPVTCIGGHETSLWPCHNSKPASCGRICNRRLNCNVHGCPLECHAVTKINSTTQDRRCRPCEDGCTIPRAPGCVHPCRRPCHEPPCYPCMVSIKASCHCGLTQIYYKCSEFHTFGDSSQLAEQKEKAMSCGDRCLKNYACGHRCMSVCHSGECPNPELCRKKVKIYCECKQKKMEVNCDKVAEQQENLKCDETCSLKKKEMALLEEQKLRSAKEAEEEKNRKELEEFEKKFGKKKNKAARNRINDEEEKKSYSVLITVTISMAISLLALTVFYYMN